MVLYKAYHKTGYGQHFCYHFSKVSVLFLKTILPDDFILVLGTFSIKMFYFKH